MSAAGGAARAELDNRTVAVLLRDALSAGGASGRVGALDTTTVELARLDLAIEDVYAHAQQQARAPRFGLRVATSVQKGGTQEDPAGPRDK